MLVWPRRSPLLTLGVIADILRRDSCKNSAGPFRGVNPKRVGRREKNTQIRSRYDAEAAKVAWDRTVDFFENESQVMSLSERANCTFLRTPRPN